LGGWHGKTLCRRYRHINPTCREKPKYSTRQLDRSKSATGNERLNEALAIGVIHKDLFTPVTAIHDVINCASILDSQLAGHVGRVAFAASLINIKN
jgi:hypothetical protein